MSTLEKATCKPAVFPFFAEREQWPPDTLNLIYRKLQDQDLLADLCHDKHVTEEEFVQFVGEETLPYLLVDLTTNQIAGIAWVSQTEETDLFKKGWGAFAFFRDYWHPPVTKKFAHLLLSHWMNFLGYDLICGLTPSTNKLALRFCRTLGMKYEAILPNYTVRRGEICDAHIAMINKTTFNAILGTDKETGIQ